jgi:hypothetical protein
VKKEFALILFGICLILLVAVIYLALSSVSSLPRPNANSFLAAAEAHKSDPLVLDERIKEKACEVSEGLPDHACTPGDVFATATPEVICVPGYTKTVRNVSVATKKFIYSEYGLSYPQPSGAYEADHLIPLELGGSNEVSNLFPEAAAPSPGFHEKDLVENYLHNQVCAGAISLAFAQMQIATDWRVVYQSLTPTEIQFLLKQFAH